MDELTVITDLTGWGWIPAAVGSNLLWMSPETLLADGLTDGQEVSSWRSLIRGYTLTQTTQAARPILKEGIQNGRAIVRFDGSDDYIWNASFPGGSQPNTLICVAKTDDADTNDRTMFGGVSPRESALTEGGYWAYDGGATDVVSATLDDSDFHVFTVVFNIASSYMRLDGTQIASGNAGGSSVLGAVVGAEAFPAQRFWDGDIGDVLWFGEELSASNIAAIEDWLMSLWGI